MEDTTLKPDGGTDTTVEEVEFRTLERGGDVDESLILKHTQHGGLDDGISVDISNDRDMFNDNDNVRNTPINIALELIHLAPAFDHISADELESALGNGIQAVFTFTDGTQMPVTRSAFNPAETITRQNCPYNIGDVFELCGDIWEYMGWPTDGPLFHIYEEYEEYEESKDPFKQQVSTLKLPEALYFDQN